MNMKRIIYTWILTLWSVAAVAANAITEVGQVTEPITISDAVDYVVTSDIPFAESGRIDITNTEHAVVILRQIRPSVAIASWLRNRIYINGQQAVNGSNCQVRMYAQGAIIFPYSNNIRPLTVYSEQNFGGEAVDDFGLEHTGGYMNTLGPEKLNNAIRSFRLKRGFMVTFSTRESGRGYSRCFIADREDLEVAVLPTILDQRITSYRVFHWYNAQKKGLASDTRENANTMLASSWCYSWGLGESRLPDAECVPNHIYEDWPSSSACGSVTYSCHMKTNNEPGNSADDHPQDVATVLANWENLMRTGMRLCSESSHDGSWGHLRAFIDSIDARGWRCDLLDLHCYWPSSNFNNWKYYYDSFGGRPIWISEWVWGASWNRNGIFGLGYDESNSSQVKAAQDRNRDELRNVILPYLNASPYVERYAYWNSERDLSKILVNAGSDVALTSAGEYYAAMESGLGYNAAYQKIPTLPRQYNPSGLVATYDKVARTVTLTWHEPNGEYNRSMVIQQKLPGSTLWSTLKTVDQQEDAADYSETVEGLDGYRYRIWVTDLNNKTRYSNEASAVNDQLEAGDEVTTPDGTMFLGGNRLTNGSFDLGLSDWENGAGEALDAPYYQCVPKGGIADGAYLQCYGSSTSATDARSIRKLMALQRDGYYYVSAAGCYNDPASQRISTTSLEKVELNVRLQLPQVTEWAKQGTAFQVTTDTILLIQLRNLGGKAQFDEFVVSRLFLTREEAQADALICARQRVAAFMAFNTQLPSLNAELDALLSASAITSADLEAAIHKALSAQKAARAIKALSGDIRTVTELKFPGWQAVAAAWSEAEQATTAQDYLDALAALQEEVGASLIFTTDASSISSPTFASAAGWKTGVGTYTAGDQGLRAQAGKTCWNAWWSLAAEGNADRTMEINQQIVGLPHGLYALECKSLTQHLCETDQHGFLVMGADTLRTPSLSLGLLDLPSFTDEEKWQTLVTPYVYVPDKDTITIGFKSSKRGASDGRWIPYGAPDSRGDNREGWWCATDFALRQIPMFRRDGDAERWGTVCLPYAFRIPEGVTLYRIAGIRAEDYSICLEEETEEVVAGRPYIFRCEDETASFFEYGSKVSLANTNYQGLRGALAVTAKYPLNSLMLIDGVWHYVTDRDAAGVIASYSGYIQKVENLTPLAHWDGLALPSIGIPDGTVGIPGIEMSSDDAIVPRFNALGQRVDSKAKGLLFQSGKKYLVQ